MSDYTAETAACLQTLQTWYNWQTGLWNTMGWWNAANALETIIDYSSLNGTQQYYPVIANCFNKLKSTNFIRPWYDDEGWWALTWVKAYDLTNIADYLTMAQAIFDDIANGWDDSTCNGGVWWQKPNHYKSAIANELFFMLAARLYLRTTTATYLQWVQKAAQWFLGCGLINAQTLINDGLGGNCQNNGQTTWTYNQGVILGALVDSFKCASTSTGGSLLGTDGSDYLARAQSIADAAITQLVDQQGILAEPCEAHGNCDGNQSLFKGIFMRNLAYLYQTLNENASATGMYDHYQQFIVKNADSLWANNRTSDYKFGLRWSGPVDSADASRQTSALHCFNAATPFSD